MMQLYINGSLVDTFGDEEVVLNRSVNNIGEIQSREGDYTNNFDLPLTAANKLIFESAHVLNSGTDIPYQRLVARIEVNGNIVSMGYAVLVESSEVFRVSYKGANADWFAEIGDKTLNDIDLVLLDHFWTGANVIDARLNNTAWTDGYCYPNVDYGLFESAATIYWYNFYTGVYAKYAMMQLFKDAGFTVTGNFYDNNTDLAKLFLPFSADFKRNTHYQHRWYIKATSDAVVFSTSGALGVLVNPTLLDSSNYSHFVISGPNAYWVILDPITVSYRLTGTATNNDGVPNEGRIRMFAYERNTATYVTAFDVATFTLAPGSNNLDITFDLDGEYIYVFQAYSPDSNNMNLDAGFIIEAESYVAYDVDDLDSYLEIISEDACYYNDTYNYIAVSGTMAPVKQADFLLTVFNEFCLMAATDNQTNYVDLFTFNDVLTNIPVARDWSSKVDLSEKPSLTYLFNQYAQTNKFSYKQDDANQYMLATTDWGGGSILIDDENLELTKTVFQSEFALIIRQDDTASGTIRMAFIPKFVAGDEADCAPYIGVIEFEALHLIDIDGYAPEAIQPAMHEIGFSYLIPLYYPALESILTNSKVLNILIHANSVDIQQLDFSVPVYLSQYGANFYVNQVKQFKLTGVESTLIELIRL